MIKYIHLFAHEGRLVPVTMFLSVLVLALFMMACTDEREAPVAPEENSYTETITLMASVVATGQDIARSFSLRDNVVSGRLLITCQLMPDTALMAYDDKEVTIDMLADANSDLEVAIINLELAGELTPEDSLLLDMYRELHQINSDAILGIEAERDSLDTYLDDRFKLSIWLDDDEVEYYPGAVFLNSSAIPYLGAEEVVWGQGFFTMPPMPADTFVTRTDTTWWAGDTVVTDPALADTFTTEDHQERIRRGYRGRTIQLDLDEFWVGDGGWDIDGAYYHPAKPARGTAYGDLFPIRDWLERLGEPGQHTLHVRFGEAGLDCKVTASLYVIYSEEG